MQKKPFGNKYAKELTKIPRAKESNKWNIGGPSPLNKSFCVVIRWRHQRRACASRIRRCAQALSSNQYTNSHNIE